MLLTIKYGIDYDNSIDISNKVLEKYLIQKYNIIYIPSNTHFNNLKGDTYPNKKKIFYIKYNNYNTYINNNQHIIIDLDENVNNNKIIPYKIKFGIDINNYIDITTEVFNKYFNFISNILYIDKNINFNNLKGVPYPDILKKITISYKDIIVIKLDEIRYENIYINYINNYTKSNKNIIIYPHLPYSEEDGGINVMYNLGRLLELENQNVRIYNSFGNIKNKIFNKYFDNDFEIDNSIVIYCEGTVGNPLNSKYVIRYLLSELGKNIHGNIFKTWGKNDLIYYFLNENKFDKNNTENIYKSLPMIYINPNIIKFDNIVRNGETCYTTRKSFHHKNKNIQNYSIVRNHYKIIRNHNFNHIIDIFNKYSYFISYDPLTFLSIISAMCGCVSIVYKVENMSKLEWLKTTAVYPYLSYKNIDNLYGVAYGLEDIEYAKNTIHLVKEQWNDIQIFLKTKYLNSFIEDINNFENCKNTYNEEAKQLTNKKDFDVYFYGTHYEDLQYFSPFELINHYIDFGNKEGRMINEKQHFYILYPNFDAVFYQNYHVDLKILNWDESILMLHYKEHGKKEGRLINHYLQYNSIEERLLIYEKSKKQTFGFIMTRHVNSEITNKYWNHSMQLLRKYYPEQKIIIIDDNSIKDFVKTDFEY